MSKTFGIVFALILVTINSPGAPLVRFPDGDSAWRVDLTPKDATDATPAPQQPKKKVTKIEIFQKDNIKRILVTFSDNAETEKWSLPNFPVVFKAAPNGSVYTVPNGRVEDFVDNSDNPSDMSSFSWVAAENLKEKDPVSVKGKLCYHYAATVKMVLLGGPPIKKKREAWIDSKTLLPVAIDTDDSHCEFTFLAPPTEPLGVPANFKKEMIYYASVMGYPKVNF